MVPRARIELARCYHRGILSPLRLPISPPRLWCYLWKKRDYSLSTGLISSPYLLLNTISPCKTDFTDFITKKSNLKLERNCQKSSIGIVKFQSIKTFSLKTNFPRETLVVCLSHKVFDKIDR